MKKTLIALAALAATSAFAQSSVTIFGVADLGWKAQTYKEAGVTTAKASGVADGAMAGQRFGFRGTEDLGGGLKANFVIEQGLSMTSAGLTNARTATSAPQVDGATTTGRSATSLNRQSWAGLTGGFGEVRIGYQYTNLYELSSLAGFNAGSEGVNGADSSHTLGNAAVGGTRANGVTYITPKMGAFSANLQFGSGTSLSTFESTVTTDTQVHANRTSAMLNYANGPLSAKVAITSYKNGSAAGGSAITDITGKMTQIGARYDLGVAALTGTYNDGENGAATTAARNYRSQQIGVTVPMGAVRFVATMGTAKTSSPTATTEDIKQNQLGVIYTLSKRTSLYAFHGTTKDSVAAGIDNKTSTTAGVLHSF
jgi:predicted porin